METSPAQALHERLLEARRQHRLAGYALATLLAELAHTRGYEELGYASTAEYAEVVLDLSLRACRDLVRVGRALPRLPLLAQAMCEGELDWTKAREVITVATPGTEAAWVGRALSVTSRELEREVARSSPGELPPTREAMDEPGPERGRLVLELDAADLDTIRRALAVLRSRSELDAEEIDDGALLAALAHRYLHDEGAEAGVSAERYRVVVERCPECGHARTPEHDLSDTVAAEAACDAEVLNTAPGPAAGQLSRVIPPATRRRVLHRAGESCEVPGCANRLWLDVHHLRFRAHGGDHGDENLAVLCSAHHRAVHLGGLGVERGEGGALTVTHREGRRPTWGGLGEPRRDFGMSHEIFRPPVKNHSSFFDGG